MQCSTHSVYTSNDEAHLAASVLRKIIWPGRVLTCICVLQGCLCCEKIIQPLLDVFLTAAASQHRALDSLHRVLQQMLGQISTSNFFLPMTGCCC